MTATSRDGRQNLNIYSQHILTPCFWTASVCTSASHYVWSHIYPFVSVTHKKIVDDLMRQDMGVTIDCGFEEKTFCPLPTAQLVSHLIQFSIPLFNFIFKPLLNNPPPSLPFFGTTVYIMQARLVSVKITNKPLLTITFLNSNRIRLRIICVLLELQVDDLLSKTFYLSVSRK